MDICTFCKIIKREIPGYIVDENDSLIVFLSLENHPLIVPKSHIVDIFTLDDAAASLVMAKAVKIAQAMKEGLGCDGIYITQANGEAAGQDVFHYHLHLYPKWKDGKNLDTDDESRKMTAEKIKGALK